jgi:hypothetical protein
MMAPDVVETSKRAEVIRRKMWLMVNERPEEHDAITDGLRKLFDGRQHAICVASMADALSWVLAELPVKERDAMLMAFAAMATQMAIIRVMMPPAGHA